MNVQGDLSERYSVASESGSSTDSHAETLENKEGEPFYSLHTASLTISSKQRALADAAAAAAAVNV